jgi:tetratricopeptide (TPR) repeat protein
LKLTGDEEKRITARYTESSSAYQQYIEGRFHWSRYTKAGIEKAIGHFRNAIELDPNYALAYAGIVDCYLRLATNYLPPENDLSFDSERNDLAMSVASQDGVSEATETSDPKVKLRYEWDWRGAERELRRANELKTDYPAAHQWNAAYKFAVRLMQESAGDDHQDRGLPKVTSLGSHLILKAILSPNEEAQVLCTVAREQIEVGNYGAACLVLRKWWTPNEWPRLEELNLPSAADLLFTAGFLTGCLSSTGLFERGQKHAEALLSGSIGLFEHLGLKRRCAEGIIELAHCYYRQGAFSLTRSTLLRALNDLSSNDTELRSICLIRLAVTERHAGHLYDSLARLNEARESVERCGALVTGRFHHEFATTLKDLALAEGQKNYSEVVKGFQQAIYEFEAIGHHRYAAVVENNFGFLLLTLEEFDRAEKHLLRARRFLEAFGDRIRAAQVDDSLARLYMATDKLELAEKAACAAVSNLENGDEEALLAESLTTKGLVLCRIGRTREARGVLEGAHRIAERCGDTEGAGRALLTVIEEIFHELGKEERLELGVRLRKLLGKSQQASTLKRLEICLDRIGKESE